MLSYHAGVPGRPPDADVGGERGSVKEIMAVPRYVRDLGHVLGQSGFGATQNQAVFRQLCLGEREKYEEQHSATK